MSLSRDEIRPDIIAQGCEKCGEPIEDGVDFILTFFFGHFIVLHQECHDFMDYAEHGSRRKPITGVASNQGE